MNSLESITYYCQTIVGQNRGEKLGFPTINMIIPPNFPYEFGIYAGWLFIGNAKIKAAIHYGPIPVFNDKVPSLEAHGINTQILQKPEEVAIILTTKIRDITNFKNEKELKTQIKKDIKDIENLL